MSCWDNPVVGLPFFSFWLVSSFITNLVLQKIVMMRANLLAENGLPKYLSIIFAVEVCTAAILISMTVAVTVAFAALDLTDNSEDVACDNNDPNFTQCVNEFERNRTNGTESDNVAGLLNYMNSLSVGQQRRYASMGFLAVGFLIFVFVLFDLFFSIFSSMVMRRALQSVQDDAAANTLVIGRDTEGAGPRFSSNLARALFFGKLNLVLVIASVSTTTLFYFALIRLSLFSSFHVVCCPPGPGRLDDQFGFVYGTWLLDSLFNDMCVLFVGFSSTEKALQTVGTTRQFGAALSVPLTQMVVGSLEMEDTTGSIAQPEVVMGRALTQPQEPMERGAKSSQNGMK
jgi:hypothetical protein